MSNDNHGQEDLFQNGDGARIEDLSGLTASVLVRLDPYGRGMVSWVVNGFGCSTVLGSEAAMELYAAIRPFVVGPGAGRIATKAMLAESIAVSRAELAAIQRMERNEKKGKD